MSRKESLPLLIRILKSVTRCFDQATARKLASLRLDKRSQALLEEMADRCTEGALSPEELEEYRAVVDAMDVIAILQIEARQQLKRKRRALVS
jgi:hypothetical protein